MQQHTRQEKIEALGRVIDTLDILRVKCPWDAKQTNESLSPNTIEEVYELAQALLNDDYADIKKELGDVLLHILFYAKIGDEKGKFDIVDVCDALNDKLIFRHPHVFGTVHVDNAEEVTQNWEQLKLKEKDGNRSVLAGVPAALPALVKSLPHTGKGRQRGLRLGAARTGMGQSRRRTLRSPPSHSSRLGRRNRSRNGRPLLQHCERRPHIWRKPRKCTRTHKP